MQSGVWRLIAWRAFTVSGSFSGSSAYLHWSSSSCVRKKVENFRKRRKNSKISITTQKCNSLAPFHLGDLERGVDFLEGIYRNLRDGRIPPLFIFSLHMQMMFHKGSWMVGETSGQEFISPRRHPTITSIPPVLSSQNAALSSSLAACPDCTKTYRVCYLCDLLRL
jgi:hypothetical protein